jgi:hypothetical protein
MKDVMKYIQEAEDRFKNPKYEPMAFSSHEELCQKSIDTYRYLDDLPQKEFFEMVNRIEITSRVDFKDFEAAAVICILRNRLQGYMQQEDISLGSDGRPVNKYRSGRHC